MPTNSLESAVQPYSAVVLGSTGNVGRQIVNLLAASPAVIQVLAINRRSSGEFKRMPKVLEVVVPEMDKLAQFVKQSTRQAGATVGFCAIGVGAGSQKMPHAEVRKIEVQYPEAFAIGCKEGGVLSMGLMTAAGSDIRSSFTYARIMGEKERAVIGVGIPALGIYRPSVIFGNSNTPTYLRYIYPAMQWALPSRFHSIHRNQLARAMFEGTQRALVQIQQRQLQGEVLAGPEIKSYEYSDMKPLFHKDDPRE